MTETVTTEDYGPIKSTTKELIKKKLKKERKSLPQRKLVDIVHGRPST